VAILGVFVSDTTALLILKFLSIVADKLKKRNSADNPRKDLRDNDFFNN